MYENGRVLRRGQPRLEYRLVELGKLSVLTVYETEAFVDEQLDLVFKRSCRRA